MHAIKIVIVVVAVCFYLDPKEQLIITENKIDQRLEIRRRQLNYIRYNMYKKIVHGHRTSCAKKSNYCVYWAYSDYCAKKDIVTLEKVAFLHAIISNL